MPWESQSRLYGPVIMTVQTIGLLMCNRMGLYLSVIFLMSSCFVSCSVFVQEDEDICISKGTTPLEVTIFQGRVRGASMVTHHGRNIIGFKGIPFAQPPIGNLRFKGPEPARSWNGTLNATSDTTPCPQLSGNDVIGDEDCLYINVYTPQLPVDKTSKLLPVMFYLTGGGFKTGSNNSTRWGPHFLLDKDIVLVVPSYRIGALGYLSTGDEIAPGNYGLKDLALALQWNFDNIEYFGGDPTQVTLAGGSSGAISAHLLTLSNLTNGLFHRYITQAGSALAPEAQQPRSVLVNRTTTLAKHFGCPIDTSMVLVNCLRGINASEFVTADSIFRIWKVFPYLIWGPTMEPDIEGALLTDTPTNLFATGKIRDLPWLTSLSRDEGIFHRAQIYNNPGSIEDFLDKIDFVLPIILQYTDIVDNVTAYTTALKSYYFNDLTVDKNLLMDNFTQLIGDADFTYPNYIGLQHFLVHATSPVYFCRFDYRGNFSNTYMFTGGSSANWGVAHGDETIYLFDAPPTVFGPSESRMNESDWKIVDTFVEFWTSFVINGTPSSSGSNGKPLWEPYSTRKNYLVIGSNSDVSLEVKYNFFEERLQFWEGLAASTSRK